MADFDSQSLPFQIKVLEGDKSQQVLQTGQPPGIIQLVGWALPFQGISFGGRQRTKKGQAPGSPNASQQAIGPEEKNTTARGEWNDINLGDGQAVALMEAIDAIRVAGLTVEVSWGGHLTGDTSSPTLTGSPIVRVGMMVDTDFTYDRVQDIKWQIEFEWRSRGQTATPPIASTAQMNPREGVSNVLDDLDLSTATWDAVSMGPMLKDVGLPQALSDAMEQAQASVQAAQDSITNASRQITTAAAIPAQAARLAVGAARGAVDAVLTAQRTILALNLVSMEVRDSALDLLRLKADLFDALEANDRAIETCSDFSAGMATLIEPDIIAEVRAPAGTDLRDLAARYYGDPDMWWAIAEYNDIDGSAVPSPPSGPSDDPNRPIRIPRPQPGASSDLRQQC